MTTYAQLEPADPLQEAADILARDGWVKGYLGGPEGRCLLGAVSAANCCSPRTVMLLAESIAQRYPCRRGTPPGWYPLVVTCFNDHPDTTWEDVMLVIKDTQARLE